MPLLEGRGPLQVSRPLTYLGNGKSAVTAKVGQSLSNRSIRESRPSIEDAVFGFRAAGPALLTNVSYFERKVCVWDPAQMKRSA